MRKGVSLILATDSWRWRMISPPNTPARNTPTEMAQKGKQGPGFFCGIAFANTLFGAKF